MRGRGDRRCDRLLPVPPRRGCNRCGALGDRLRGLWCALSFAGCQPSAVVHLCGYILLVKHYIACAASGDPCTSIHALNREGLGLTLIAMNV